MPTHAAFFCLRPHSRALHHRPSGRRRRAFNYNTQLQYASCLSSSFFMRRSFKKNSGSKLSADSQRLTTFSQAIDQAASRLEERYWEDQLDALLHKLLRNHHQDAIDAALDHLFKQESGAYDALMESVEAA